MEKSEDIPEHKLNQVCAELKALMLKHNLNFADIARCLAIIANKEKK